MSSPLQRRTNSAPQVGVTHAVACVIFVEGVPSAVPGTPTTEAEQEFPSQSYESSLESVSSLTPLGSPMVASTPPGGPMGRFSDPMADLCDLGEPVVRKRPEHALEALEYLTNEIKSYKSCSAFPGLFHTSLFWTVSSSQRSSTVLKNVAMTLLRAQLAALGDFAEKGGCTTITPRESRSVLCSNETRLVFKVGVAEGEVEVIDKGGVVVMHGTAFDLATEAARSSPGTFAVVVSGDTIDLVPAVEDLVVPKLGNVFIPLEFDTVVPADVSAQETPVSTLSRSSSWLTFDVAASREDEAQILTRSIFRSTERTMTAMIFCCSTKVSQIVEAMIAIRRIALRYSAVVYAPQFENVTAGSGSPVSASMTLYRAVLTVVFPEQYRTGNHAVFTAVDFSHHALRGSAALVEAAALLGTSIVSRCHAVVCQGPLDQRIISARLVAGGDFLFDARAASIRTVSIPAGGILCDKHSGCAVAVMPQMYRVSGSGSDAWLVVKHTEGAIDLDLSDTLKFLEAPTRHGIFLRPCYEKVFTLLGTMMSERTVAEKKKHVHISGPLGSGRTLLASLIASRVSIVPTLLVDCSAKKFCGRLGTIKNIITQARSYFACQGKGLDVSNSEAKLPSLSILRRAMANVHLVILDNHEYVDEDSKPIVAQWIDECSERTTAVVTLSCSKLALPSAVSWEIPAASVEDVHGITKLLSPGLNLSSSVVSRLLDAALRVSRGSFFILSELLHQLRADATCDTFERGGGGEFPELWHFTHVANETNRLIVEHTEALVASLSETEILLIRAAAIAAIDGRTSLELVLHILDIADLEPELFRSHTLGNMLSLNTTELIFTPSVRPEVVVKIMPPDIRGALSRKALMCELLPPAVEALLLYYGGQHEESFLTINGVGSPPSSPLSFRRRSQL